MSAGLHVVGALLQLLAAVSEAEREVAEVRQLREEEDALLLAAVQAMAALWQQLLEVRRLQGGRHLTDLAFSVVQLPPAQGEEAPMQAVSTVLSVAQHSEGLELCIQQLALVARFPAPLFPQLARLWSYTCPTQSLG